MNTNTKLIVGGRNCGKTYSMVQEFKENHGILIVATPSQKEALIRIYNLEKRRNDIMFFEEARVRTEKYNVSLGDIYIDNVDQIIGKLLGSSQIKTMSVTSNESITPTGENR